MKVSMFHGSDSMRVVDQSARAASTPIGTPPPSALPATRMSGWTPKKVARPSGAASRHAGLDLVDDEQHTALAAGPLDGVVVSRREENMPVRALDDLHNEGGDLAVSAVEGAVKRTCTDASQAPSPSGLR